MNQQSTTTKFTEEEIEQELKEKQELEKKDDLKKKYYDQGKSDIQKTIKPEDFDLKK